jgi:Spy/CpxP family protein refolding chaperone
MAYSQTYAESGNESDPCAEDRGAEDRGAEDRGASIWYAHRQHRHRGKRGSSSFGVRRPLRYLSYQLDLDESQRRRIAALLDSVKTEREQSALDEKKMVAELADLVVKEDVSTDALEDTLSARVRGTRQVQTLIAKALKEISTVLDADQREEFSYLLRSGAFRI